MRSFDPSVKLSSRVVWPSVLGPVALLTAAAALSAGLVGCLIVDDNNATGGGPPTTTPPALDIPKQVSITGDKTLDAKPGEGVGIFIEYASGGHWHVRTSCDTNSSKVTCNFDVFASAIDNGAAITNITGEELESSDVAETAKDGSAHLGTTTSSEFDGMFFDAPAGSRVEFEVYFDGIPNSRVVYWYGGGVLHTGSPTDPVDMAPEAK
jgi:hypothetical protein